MKTLTYLNIITLLILFGLYSCSCTNKILKEKTLSKIQINKTKNKIKEKFQKNILEGIWEATGFICGDQTVTNQEVLIFYEDDNFIAHKIQGDHCVPKGSVAFRGKLPSSFDVGNKYPCELTSGNPSSPSSSIIKICKIDIIDGDHFKISSTRNIIFKRKSFPHENNISFNPVPSRSPVPDQYPEKTYDKIEDVIENDDIHVPINSRYFSKCSQEDEYNGEEEDEINHSLKKYNSEFQCLDGYRIIVRYRPKVFILRRLPIIEYEIFDSAVDIDEENTSL